MSAFFISAKVLITNVCLMELSPIGLMEPHSMRIFNPGCRKDWEGESQKQAFPGRERDGAIAQFFQQAGLFSLDRLQPPL